MYYNNNFENVFNNLPAYATNFFRVFKITLKMLFLICGKFFLALDQISFFLAYSSS